MTSNSLNIPPPCHPPTPPHNKITELFLSMETIACSRLLTMVGRARRSGANFDACGKKKGDWGKRAHPHSPVSPRFPCSFARRCPTIIRPGTGYRNTNISVVKISPLSTRENSINPDTHCKPARRGNVVGFLWGLNTKRSPHRRALV